MLRHAYQNREHIPNFRIELGCQRRPVRRGHSSFVGLFPSTKSVETVQYESTLERDALILFEADPSVTAISFQPMAVSWYDGERMRIHVPDFLLERNGNEEVIEVKPRAKLLDPAVAARTALMVRNFAALGRRYVVLTEDDIRTGPALANAKVMMNGLGQMPCDADAGRAIDFVAGAVAPPTVAEVAAVLGHEPHLVNCVYALMIAGIVEVVDVSLPLDGRCRIRLRTAELGDVSHAL